MFMISEYVLEGLAESWRREALRWAPRTTLTSFNNVYLIRPLARIKPTVLLLICLDSVGVYAQGELYDGDRSRRIGPHARYILPMGVKDYGDCYAVYFCERPDYAVSVLREPKRLEALTRRILQEHHKDPTSGEALSPMEWSGKWDQHDSESRWRKM